ncbi:butyrophilin subfamily 3 member A3-like [Cololabis saira]|uniref:butyrophilin subfamily 3 member A3-like n=1 Tax=Cololabis saira TaxID=129043 RepID=UPI002AD2931E|nr:butyrophilin subfamily 3 member A3-like [Cololabis saira]
MINLWILVLFASTCSAAPVSEIITVSARSHNSVEQGQTATLPCWVNPSQSAEDLEVRWYRGDRFDTPVMLRKAKKFVHETQESSYNGRVSFGVKDAASGGLKTGDVSLQLVNVTIGDEGVYTCYISREFSHDSTTASLSVTVTGNPPLLSAVWKEDNVVNVSCESEGWYPQPVLRWSDGTKDLNRENPMYSRLSSGLYSVRSWLTVPTSSEVSCSVGLHDEHMQRARMRLEHHQRDSSSGGWVAFGILFSIVLAGLVLGAVYLKKKGTHQGIKNTNSNEETKGLLSKENQALSAARQCYVNVKLEDAKSEFIIIRGNKVRDSGKCPDGDEVTCLTAIKGTPGFSSGQHYWEVSLGHAYLEPKKSWWIGVTSAAEITSNFSPNTSNGFWFLSSSPNIENTLQFNTEPRICLPIQSRPKKVGVYLDYDKGVLSFYDVEDERLISSLATVFIKEVFPFFNPGTTDHAVMEILQRTEQINDAVTEKST